MSDGVGPHLRDSLKSFWKPSKAHCNTQLRKHMEPTPPSAEFTIVNDSPIGLRVIRGLEKLDFLACKATG